MEWQNRRRKVIIRVTGDTELRFFLCDYGLFVGCSFSSNTCRIFLSQRTTCINFGCVEKLRSYCCCRRRRRLYFSIQSKNYFRLEFDCFHFERQLFPNKSNKKMNRMLSMCNVHPLYRSLYCIFQNKDQQLIQIGLRSGSTTVMNHQCFL